AAMTHGFGRAVRALFAPVGSITLSWSPSRSPDVRMRRITVGFLALVILIGLGVGVYARFFRTTALVETPRFDDTGNRLPTPDGFGAWGGAARVKWPKVGRTGSQGGVRGAATATLGRGERVYGAPKPPKAPPEELIRLAVRKDVPAGDEKPRPQIRMVWES